MSFEHQVGQSACGQYKVAIVDSKTGQVVWEQPEWKKNLILNNGLAHIASDTWANAFTSAVAGTSSTANTTDSGATTATSDAAGNVTLAGGSFTFAGGSADVGNIIQWDNGTEGRLVTTATGTSATITPAPGVTVSASHFILFRTNRTSLVAESKRTNTYLTGAPNCQSSRTGNVLSLRRTYDFSAESGSVSYNEVGVAWDNTLNAANTTFARIVLSVPISLTIGQQLRLVYQLNIALSPTSLQSGSASVSGWPVAPSVNTNGSFQMQYIGMSNVSTSGASSFFDAGVRCNEPSSIGTSSALFITVDSQAPNTFAAAPPNRGVTDFIGASIVNADTTGVSMFQSKQVTWATGAVNGTSWRTIGVGDNVSSDPGVNTGFVFVFTQSQSKANTQTLTLAFKFTWSRTLAVD